LVAAGTSDGICTGVDHTIFPLRIG
jgi:hypothetical protein